MMIVISLAFFLVVIFLVMITVMRRIINQNVVSATSHLEEMNQDYAKKDEEINKRYEEAERQSKKLVLDAQKDAEAEKQRVILETQKEKEDILNQAHKKADEIVEKADSARIALITDIERKIDDKAIVRAEELAGLALPDELRRQAHSRLFNEFIEASLDQLKNLAVPEGVSDVKVVSAFVLDAAQKQAIADKLKEKAHRDFNISEEVSPDLISGVMVTIGHIVLDGSLKSIVSRRAKELLVKAREG